MGTFGDLLNQLFDRITQVIQALQSAGLVLEVNAGAQIQNLIYGLKGLLEDTLNTAAKDMSAQQQQLISGASELIDDVEHKIIDNFTSKLQTIFNTLPLANHFPQVAGFEGNVLAGNITDEWKFTLTGNFFDIGEADYDAEIQYGTLTLPTTVKGTQTLEFILPKDHFTFEEGSITYSPFSVSIPYKKGLFHKKTFANFKFAFILLPRSGPGYVVFTPMELVEPQLEVDKNPVCAGLVWDSSQDDIDLVQGCDMQDNWECDRESVWHHYVKREGGEGVDFFDLGNASTSTFVGWHFKTLHKAVGTSGKVTVDLHYTRTRQPPKQDQPVPQPPYTLSWGEHHAFSMDTNATWTLTFHQFNGVSKDYVKGGDESNPYLTIDGSVDDKVVVAVIPQSSGLSG